MPLRVATMRWRLSSWGIAALCNPAAVACCIVRLLLCAPPLLLCCYDAIPLLHVLHCVIGLIEACLLVTERGTQSIPSANRPGTTSSTTSSTACSRQHFSRQLSTNPNRHEHNGLKKRIVSEEIVCLSLPWLLVLASIHVIRYTTKVRYSQA